MDIGAYGTEPPLSESARRERLRSEPESLAKLVSLLEDQITILRQIDQRQAAADVSKQPIPQIPATSSSTWGALLRSTVSETIQPNVDRWRSGLDALLVFLGLFSAIVTAFLVDSLPGLQQDEIARTNELLANLTEIVIQLSGTAVNITPPATFEPAAAEIRLNSYWSVSLILSLSVAALAVTLRGSLNMLALSPHTKALDKIVDIKHRWNAAEKTLGPIIEVIPHLLVIPVLLFVVGLLDNILSDVLSLSSFPVPIVVALCMSLIFIVGVVLFFALTFLDASVRPDSSPFQSTLSRAVRKIFALAPSTSPWPRKHRIPGRVARTYHEIVQTTHDDETLDSAAAALSGMIESLTLPGAHQSQECATLVHLLSTEASARCNLTAAEVIIRLEHIFGVAPDPRTSPFEPILTALARAARRRAHRLPLEVLWTSPFLGAMAVLSGAAHTPHPPVVCILGSEHVSHLDPEILDLLFDIYGAVCPAPTPHPPPPHLVALFQPPFIAPLRVLEALHHLHPLQLDKRAAVVALLVAAQPPESILDAARDLFLTAPPRAEAVFACTTAALVVQACLAAGVAPPALADLATRCVLGLRDHAHTVGFLVEHFSPVVEALRAVLAEVPPGAAAVMLGGLMAAGNNPAR